MAINTLADLQKNGISQEEYWSKRILAMIVLEKDQMVFQNLGKDMDIPANEGTTSFSVRRYNRLPVGNHQLAEGILPTALKVEAHKVTGVVNQFGAYIKETDVASAIHFDNIRTIYQPELARHASEVIERNIIASFTDASEYFVGVGNLTINDIADTDVATLKDFRTVGLTMRNFLRKGHSKFGDKPVTVTHPNVMQDLLDDDTLEKKLLVPGQENTPIKTGTLAKYMAYGMYFIETLICEVEENATNVNVYTSYVLGRDPYMVLKLSNNGVKFYNTGFTADKADPLAQFATIGYKLWTGAKILDPMAITKVYSASAYDVVADFTGDDLGSPASQI